MRKYREAYAAPDRLLAFLPAIMSTSGRIHGEFLRLLYILSHRQAVNFFELFGKEPTDNAFTSPMSVSLRGFPIKTIQNQNTPRGRVGPQV